MKITVTHDDGTTTDVTEGVQVAYDAVRSSLDWGSGFLDTEEVDAVVGLAVACRFPDFEELVEEVRRDREAEEKRQAEGLLRLEQARRQEQDRRVAERHLADEMRLKEPKLVHFSDSQLVRLHAMRNAGTA